MGLGLGLEGHLPQPGVLGGSPLSHLQQAHDREEDSCQRLSGHTEGDPAQDFCGVVGAGDEVEEESPRNLDLLRARWPKVCQNYVAPEDHDKTLKKMEIGVWGGGGGWTSKSQRWIQEGLRLSYIRR